MYLLPTPLPFSLVANHYLREESSGPTHAVDQKVEWWEGGEGGIIRREGLFGGRGGFVEVRSVCVLYRSCGVCWIETYVVELCVWNGGGYNDGLEKMYGFCYCKSEFDQASIFFYFFNFF